MKLLGRIISYRALETHLKHMWVKKGAISIIDLSNDYYLVSCTHDDGKNADLTKWLWFIYDHYLMVKEWSFNFHPTSGIIENVVVWICISKLLIQYYDAKVLFFVGNWVWRVVEVDKNMLQQKRWKYARLFVEVIISKPLIAMFTTKGRKYNIEYEACISCASSVVGLTIIRNGTLINQKN